MSTQHSKSKALLWRAALVGGLIVEVALIVVAILAITRENQTIPAWQQIAFVAILVWIYIAYLKQRSMDISAFVVDEKIKVHSLVENLAEGVILLDPDNKMLLLNARVAELTGLSEIESLGKDLSGEVDAVAREMLSAGRAGETDVKFTRSGKTLRFSLKLLPTHSAEGNHKLICLRESDKTLAGAGRLDAGEETLITETLKALCETVIKSCGEVTSDERNRRVRLAVKGQASALLIQARSLLEQIRKQSLAASVKKQRVAVDSMIQALLPEATSAAGAAGIKIDAPQVSKDQFVMGDAELLKLALKQALINALAVSPSQSTVMLKTAELGENIGISVIDRGPDIDPGKTPQLFELVYTGATGKDGKTVRKESIGYYLARGIVEAHGGSLWADTPPEGGLRISMMLARG